MVKKRSARKPAKKAKARAAKVTIPAPQPAASKQNAAAALKQKAKELRGTLAKIERATGGIANYPDGTPTEDLMNREQAATALGCVARTLWGYEQQWKAQGYEWGAGRVGGGSLGWYPLKEIRIWIAANVRRNGNSGGGLGGLGGPREKTRLEEIEELRAERDWRIESGEFVIAADVEIFFSRVIATARALLDGLADEVGSCLPADTAAEVAAHVRSRVGAKVVDVYAVLRELTQGDADAAEEAAELAEENEASDKTEV